MKWFKFCLCKKKHCRFRGMTYYFIFKHLNFVLSFIIRPFYAINLDAVSLFAYSLFFVYREFEYAMIPLMYFMNLDEQCCFVVIKKCCWLVNYYVILILGYRQNDKYHWNLHEAQGSNPDADISIVRPTTYVTYEGQVYIQCCVN
jgi:hypothetical protein